MLMQVSYTDHCFTFTVAEQEAHTLTHTHTDIKTKTALNYAWRVLAQIQPLRLGGP